MAHDNIAKLFRKRQREKNTHEIRVPFGKLYNSMKNWNDIDKIDKNHLKWYARFPSKKGLNGFQSLGMRPVIYTKKGLEFNHFESLVLNDTMLFSVQRIY